MKIIYPVLYLFVFSLICDGKPSVSFNHEVLPILSKQGCSQGSCHGSPHGKGHFRLSLRAFDPSLDSHTIFREELGRRINPIEPEKSLLLLKPTMAISHEGGERLKPDGFAYKLLREWIREGCPTPEEESQCIKLEITPGESKLLKWPDFSLQLSARATFSDGSSRDVTRLSVFTTSDENVAVVDASGKVSGNNRGKVAILVRYLEQVQSIHITLSRKPEGFTWKAPPPVNYIDEKVYAKLRLLHYPPSPLISDATFLRRIHLDLTGLLPKAEVVRDFLSNETPDKRSQLIESLLDSPDYAKYWARKWGDLLRLSRKQVGEGAVYKFADWLERSIATNQPYDDFARDLLTAKGSSLLNPEANFIRTTINAEDAMESTSQLFLGSRIQCAKCHNHPFERWTQDNYYGLTAFFARTKTKKLGKSGETFIWNAKEGEVRHPVTGTHLPPWVPDSGAFEMPPNKDRRQVFAEWLTKPGNPFFARVEVNRIWAALMGVGIVEPFDDFRDTNPPSNEPLLEALSRDFVKSGFDRRHLIRIIVNSNVYQTSGESNEFNRDDTRFFSFRQPRRLEAEQLVDALGQVTGKPMKFHGVPVSVKAVHLPAPDLLKRNRSMIGDVEFLKVFGQPERQTVCSCERAGDAGLGQALQLFNGKLFHGMLTAGDSLFRKSLSAGKTLPDIVENLHLSALSRFPNEKEQAIALTYLEKATDKGKALEDLCWAILNRNEFLFNH
ncbi:MAG: DUF1553 domain-containing protein [Opitutae bacterium]|nr:DUF1553 domain-containing protein [Opitutae bacterium]